MHLPDKLDYDINYIEYRSDMEWTDEIPYFVAKNNRIDLKYWIDFHNNKFCEECAWYRNTAEDTDFKFIKDYEWIIIGEYSFWCAKCRKRLFIWHNEYDNIWLWPESIPLDERVRRLEQ